MEQVWHIELKNFLPLKIYGSQNLKPIKYYEK